MYSFKSRLHLAYLPYLYFFLLFLSNRRITEWWIMDRLAQALVLLVILLLEQGVKPFWLVGFHMLYICVLTELVDVTWV